MSHPMNFGPFDDIWVHNESKTKLIMIFTQKLGNKISVSYGTPWIISKSYLNNWDPNYGNGDQYKNEHTSNHKKLALAGLGTKSTMKRVSK